LSVCINLKNGVMFLSFNEFREYLYVGLSVFVTILIISGLARYGDKNFRETAYLIIGVIVFGVILLLSIPKLKDYFSL